MKLFIHKCRCQVCFQFNSVSKLLFLHELINIVSHKILHREKVIKHAQLIHTASDSGELHLEEKTGKKQPVKVKDGLADGKRVLFPFSDPIQALAALHSYLFLMASHCPFFL